MPNGGSAIIMNVVYPCVAASYIPPFTMCPERVTSLSDDAHPSDACPPTTPAIKRPEGEYMPRAARSASSPIGAGQWCSTDKPVSWENELSLVSSQAAMFAQAPRQAGQRVGACERLSFKERPLARWFRPRFLLSLELASTVHVLDQVVDGRHPITRSRTQTQTSADLGTQILGAFAAFRHPVSVSLRSQSK